MILLIDNYDSFSYNLYQLVGSIRTDIRVIRNDEMTVEDIRSLHPDHIILSPGPGRPAEAGICEEVVRKLGAEIPILGVCLGHQAICEVYGMEVTYAKKLMHGKQSLVQIDRSSRIFQGLEPQIHVARYHSLIGKERPGADALRVIGRSAEDEIMAVAHQTYPVYGLQFHPESILTEHGAIIMKNFLEV